ncbi:MAG: hypothetical protein NVS2B12_12120 [Ktedonobacteraceae bacterium]
MSATQIPTENEQSHILHCTRCNAVLPQYAVFCGQCGQRVQKQEPEASSPNYSDIVERYRITSLVRRRPYTQLFFALDNQLQRTVAINAINMSTLAEAARAEAIELLQQQYDVLRRLSMPTIMRMSDLRYFQEHLYIIAEWPGDKEEAATESHPRHLTTLFSLLQSGIGLPASQVAIAWIYRLSRTLEILHKNSIVPGDIDPDTILVSGANFDGDLSLMASWLPTRLSELLPRPSIDTNTAYFYAPETLIGESEPRSDIYSLGAILYLLLSGVTPQDATERTKQPLTTLREINPRINSSIDSVVTRALALEKSERYQSASEFSEALLQLSTNPNDLRHAQKNHTRAARSSVAPPEQTGTENEEEIYISSPTADTVSNELVDAQDAQPRAENEDATILMVPLQAQMARRYLSKMKTGKTETTEKQSGEESVEEGRLTKNGGVGEKANAEGGAAGPSSQADTSAMPEAELLRAEQRPGPVRTTIKLEPGERQPEAYPTEDIQNQRTISLGTGKMEQAEQTTHEAEEERTHQIEQQATIPFKYEVVAASASDIHKQIKDQEEKDRQQEKNSRALQVQGTTSVSRQSGLSRETISELLKAMLIKTTASLPALMRPLESTAANRALSKQITELKESQLVKQVQHFLLGEPQNSTKAAALIETPLRIQPGQSYSIRINVIGRDKPKSPQSAGLSALAQGEKVHIEIRSALYQNYAYIVQQADIEIPRAGYVAEITMPMQPLSGGPSGRRERLHIFFMDEANSPLYEKPFVIELFISHLVQSGREGHNVLSIPM